MGRQLVALLLTVLYQLSSCRDFKSFLLSNLNNSIGVNRTHPAIYRLPGVDPETRMSACQIADYHGYRCEEYLHKVVTKDGFLLTLHRVNGRKGEDVNSTHRPPVFVQHGLLCDSSSWMLNFPKQSLPYILSDNGYDVWLANSRGNTYSRAHKTLKPDDDAFWAWSWDEMALYDLPDSIDFVLAHTGYTSLQYIGHSQGTLIAFAHLSITNDPKISQLIAMGPVFNIAHMTSALMDFSPFAYDIAFVMKIFGLRDFLPNIWEIKFLAETLCNEYDPIHPLCADILFVIAGYDAKQLNQTRIPVYLTHIPAGTSVRNMLHFVQMYEAKNCSRFNFGSVSENIKHYGTGVPPAYNISKIENTPITLFYAQHDSLADTKDVQYIIDHLRNIREAVYVPNWDHLDFIWALDAPAIAYDKILTLLKK